MANPWQRGLILSLLTVSATAAAFGTQLIAARFFGAGSGVAVLAAVLALTRTRRAAAEGAAHAWLIDLWRLPVIAGLATATAVILHRYFVLGAALFIAIVSLATWLPSLGSRARSWAGALMLPLIAVLIAPASPHAPGGPWVDLLLVVLAAWVAQSYAWLAQALARRLRLREVAVEPAMPDRAKPGRISGYARMALQMAAALIAAFALGHWLFGAHWSWCVLTAYIVCAGRASRGEAVYTGLLRTLGALAGTLAAALMQSYIAPEGALAAVVIFASLLVGVWLRDFNYAFWAACMTLVMATLQGVAGNFGVGELNVRLAAIFVGALCAIAATWFLLPLSTRTYARRVVADALAAFDQSLRSGADGEIARCLARLERIAPALNLHRFVMRSRRDSDHPSLWVANTLRCSRSIMSFTGDKAALLRAIGVARRTLSRRDASVCAALDAVENLARGSEASR